MQSDDPAFLPPGTEVSAKFKGAFCEAKIKKLYKSVKCKIVLKEAPFGSMVVEEHLVKGALEVNQTVDVYHGKHSVKGVIQHIKDCSTYHVVFNDGDEKILRRTQMCLKGAKHFDTESNLDQMPLYNPEQFCAAPKPQAKAKKPKKAKRRRDEESEDEEGKKRKKRAAASAASVAIGEMDHGDTEGSGDGDVSGSEGDSSDIDVEAEKEDRKKKDKKEDDEKKEDSSRKSQQTGQKVNMDKIDEKREKFCVGSVVCVYEDSQHKGKWFPAVVVNPKAYRDGNSKVKNPGKSEVALRSFQNGKYSVNPLVNLVRFEDHSFIKDSMSAQLRTAIDRTNSFLSKGNLPYNWTAKDIYAENIPRKKYSTKNDPSKVNKKCDSNESNRRDEDVKKKKTVDRKMESNSSDTESSDEEEYGEERDLFVAQLYKFQEERGTPINRAPILGGKDIDLYRFYRVVQDYGGYKRVTTNQKWKKVLSKLHLEGCPGATPATVRKAYIRYLAHFNSFYKRLGWSLDELSITSTINSPRERRLIRPAELLNQSVKKRKANTVDAKEKSVKKGKEKVHGRESKETSRDLEFNTHPERSICPSTSTTENTHKIDLEENDQKNGSRVKDEEIKEKLDKKEKKEKLKEKDKEERNDQDDKVEEKTTEHDDTVEKTECSSEMKAEEEVPTIAAAKLEAEVSACVSANERRNSDLGSRCSNEMTDKDSSVDRKDTEGSDEEGEGKRKKERRKLSKSDKKSGDYGDSGKYKDPDEGYHPANITSRFYLGQKVRAHHHGRWYDARVVTVEQPPIKEIIDIMEMQDDEGEGLSPLALTRLRAVMTSTRCFVHYLGWNSRYDESITLNKIRLSEKDSQSSLNAIMRAMGERIPKSRLDFLLRWSSSTDGVESLTHEDNVTPNNLFSMGGYRPRRVSISQYEQLSAAAAAEGLKRESSKTSGSVSLKTSQPLRTRTPTSTLSKTEHSTAPLPIVGSSSPLRSSVRSYESTMISKNVSSPPPLSQATRSRAIYSTITGKESVSATISTCSNPPPTTIYISTSHEKFLATPQQVLSTPPSSEEISNSFEIYSRPWLSSKNNSAPPTLVILIPVKEFAYMLCNESPPKEKKKACRASMIQDVISLEENETGTPNNIHYSVEIAAKNGGSGLATTDEHLKKTLISVEYSCLHGEMYKEEAEFKSENDSSTICHTSSQYESDAEPSGSVTPLRTDGEDNDKLSTSDNQSGSGRIMSPGRGRGSKRKRAAYNRHSTMVIDRKYIRSKGAGKDERKDDDSYGEEEEEEATRDTFISMKNKTFRLMEQEQSLENFDLLGLPPIEDFSLSTDDAIEILERRLSELREIYHQSKSELLHIEKRRRKYAEKKKERERASREAISMEK